MPRLMTQHQRSLCIELIPKMMSGDLEKRVWKNLQLF